MRRLLIIPAAGAGTRLRSSVPKVLFPVNGRPMVDYLFELYSPLVERFMLVVHPAFADPVRRHCSGAPWPVEYAVQESPTGMLDAILISADRVRGHAPENVWITWCDQIAIRRETVHTLGELAERERGAGLIFPTMRRPDPYIHFVRDEEGEICRVLQQREGDAMPEVGESDMGLFHLSLDAYARLLPAYAREAAAGTGTRERNFLPFIPWLRGRARVVTFPGREAIEAVGINTTEELDRVSAHLRHGH